MGFLISKYSKKYPNVDKHQKDDYVILGKSISTCLLWLRWFFLLIESLWKKGVFCNWPCNSLYIYMSWMLINKFHELQSCISVYIRCNSLQFYQTNPFSNTMQLHYNYTHDVMLTSLIVIHLLKSNIWHYEDFWT